MNLLRYIRSTSEQDEEERLIALVESLRGPMAAHGATLKQYLKDALLPAYNSIKAAHSVLDDKGGCIPGYTRVNGRPLSRCCILVDLAFGAGLLTFDEVCKKVERIALGDENELKTTHAESQVRPPATLLP